MKLFGALRNYVWPSAIKVALMLIVQTTHKEWTLSQERVFMEDLVYKRLTLFPTLAAALITGAISLRATPWLAGVLLAGGTILCWVIQQTVHRVQLKLDIILQIFFDDKGHPTGRVNSLYNDRSRIRLVGVGVPSAVCLLLTVWRCAELVIAARSVVQGTEQGHENPRIIVRGR